ncbi:polysaccharide biosynthesis tyrosine autokinase [Bifidobacterium stellenboschense]|uniref:non-specific protein-tyrosine kinase n=1 Tax=Bifidobacterium stellenboschense TaxID=762211 RepID=A0A087DKU0_9BIFI|nr:polysaccharide biosynthesis tyrosine autokinase [Bifidobacterium stellenboschense]KFI96140.1 lipopolysaccharide biosynthesis protein [Bifidobacterium stellenboschense]
MTVADILEALKKHLIVELAVLLVVLAGGYAYVSRQTPQYTATTQMFASVNHSAIYGSSDASAGEPSGDDSTKSSPTADASGDTSYISGQVGALPTLVTTPAVLQPVIDDLGLDTTVDALGTKITVSTQTTYFVNVSVVDTNPKRAANIANAVSRSLKKQISADSYASEKTYVLSLLNLAVVRQAEVPKTPSSPNVKSFMFKMTLAGIVAAVCVALIIEAADKRLRQIADLQRLADAPTLGVLLKDDAFQASAPVVVSAPSGSAAESIRRLALNLMFIAPDRTEQSNVIVISSAGQHEGKTTVAVNLAAALAEKGEKVLLIDTDLRRPSVAKALNINGKVGLSHLLAGQVGSKDAIQQYWKPNFHVLPAGDQTTNPSILINSHAMQELLKQVASTYDHVIIDTTPMRVANDAAVFAKEGARLILVASQGVTVKKQLRDTMQEFEMIGVAPVGTVFNNDHVKRGKNSYYYYGDYAGKGKSSRARKGRRSATDGKQA